MKITRRQLRKIVAEINFAGREMFELEADERARDELATQIRNASKDIYGTKDHYDLRGKSIEQLEDILHDLANSPEQKYLDDEAQREMEDEMGRDHDLSRAEMAPRRQGMSRRPAGSKSQRRMESRFMVTEKELREAIRRELQVEFFGFGKAKVPRDSSGNVSVGKLPREEQDIFIQVKSAVRKSGRTQDAFDIVKSLGHDPEDYTELIQAAMDAGKIAYSHSQM